jgi:hypothetical protein
MTARDVARGLNQSRAIVACSALTDRRHVHRSNKIKLVVLEYLISWRSLPPFEITDTIFVVDPKKTPDIVAMTRLDIHCFAERRTEGTMVCP